ncbi:MAG TPA: J domain-containing protein [Bacteriovoracaceae bacterium]|nr:J domain-containing protein [Bacteriovoracaceae bacterium]
MDAGQYYITTLTNAALKLGPMVLYLLAGYFLFVKLPFLLFYKTLQKPKVHSNDKDDFQTDLNFQKKMEDEQRKEFEERMKNLGGAKKEETKEEKKEKKEEQRKTENRQEKKRREETSNKRPSKKSEQIQATPEEILFKLRPGQMFTGQELKKRYHKLLQENHPDKFRTDHQKEVAESKTKDINDAYQKLKKRVPS